MSVSLPVWKSYEECPNFNRNPGIFSLHENDVAPAESAVLPLYNSDGICYNIR